MAIHQPLVGNTLSKAEFQELLLVPLQDFKAKIQSIYRLNLGKQNPRLGDLSGVAPPSNSDHQDNYDICWKSLLQTLTFHC